MDDTPKMLDIRLQPDVMPVSHYEVTVDWRGLEDHIARQQEYKGLAVLDLNPDFQRGHVWTEDQQRTYIEFILLGGMASDVLTFNCVGWMSNFKGPFVIVDGKQRLEAVRKFMRGELRVFKGREGREEGFLPAEILGVARATFKWRVHNLATREDVLKLYLGMNRGGTPHTDDEISKVEGMLKETVQK